MDVLALASMPVYQDGLNQKKQTHIHTKMKKLLIALLVVPFCVFAAAKPPKAAKAAKVEKVEKADKYQVTGSVTEVSDSKIVVMKGKVRNEFARNTDTKVDGGELKVGSKVTVKYVMTAATVDVKAEKAEKKADKKAAKTDAAKPAAAPAEKPAEAPAEKK